MGASIVVDDKMISNNRPQFLINFKQQPVKVEGKGRIREFYFSKDRGIPPVLIGYNSWIEPTNIEAYYSLPHIIAINNFTYLGSVHFAGHEWAKVAKYNYQYEHLTYGYYTRKDNAIIFVLNRTWDIERKIKYEFEDLTPQNLSDLAKREIDFKFEHLDGMVEIVY